MSEPALIDLTVGAGGLPPTPPEARFMSELAQIDLTVVAGACPRPRRRRAS